MIKYCWILAGGRAMDTIKEIIDVFEDKLAAIREMINTYDETMDYASHCTLQGFAEGLMYVIEELRTRQ
jgi:hypothetical protein